MPFARQIDYTPILELLHTGLTDTAVAARIGCSRPTVRMVRVRNNLPAPLHGSTSKHHTFDDVYRAHAIPTTDGHMTWTGGHNGVTPTVHHLHQGRSAYKIAFRLHHQREPQGLVKVGCHQPGCVAGAHLTDATIRKAIQEAEAAGRPVKAPGPAANGTRAEIIALISEGRSNKEIAGLLRTNVARVRTIRRSAGLPAWARSAVPIESKWATWVRPTTGGHARWVGTLRGGTPNIAHGQRNHSARAVGFTMLHGRPPVGKVLPGCGMAWCVSPEHSVDDVMRRADRVYDRIFGVAA